MKKLTMCASIAALTLASQAATAGPYSDIYAFGDSLYDSGNFGVDRRATNNAGPDYNTGPSGLIGIQFIAEHLDVELLPSEFGGTNYAVGGHRAADTLASVTADTTYQQAADLSSGRLYNSLFYDLRRNNQTLDPDALFVVEGGGNDIVPGSYSTVADNLLAATQALIDNGANYVVLVDFPVFSKSPLASAGGKPIQDFARGIEISVNNQLRSGVDGIDGNIILLDGNGFALEFFADPSVFGFTKSGSELASQCFNSSQDACQAGTTGGNLDSDAPDPDQFFFNDPLHPTTIGQRISSGYIISVLNAGSELALLPSLAMNSVQAQWQAARPTMRANRWGSDLTDGDSKFSVYGTVQQSENNQDTLISSLEGENEAQSYHVGVNFHASDNAYFGVLLGRSDNELNLGLSQYEMTSTDISFLGAYHNDAYFVEAIYTFSDNDYSDLDRSFSLGPVNRRTETGSTDGDTTSLAVQAGYDLFKGEENYRLGPIIGYEYIDTTVDAYQENASLSTSLIVSEQNVSSSVLLAGIFGSIGLGLCDCEFYGEAVLRNEDKDDRNDVELALVTIASNQFNLPGQSLDDDSVTVDLGFNANLTEALSLNISAGASDSDDSDRYWYGATLAFDL